MAATIYSFVGSTYHSTDWSKGREERRTIDGVGIGGKRKDVSCKKSLFRLSMTESVHRNEGA